MGFQCAKVIKIILANRMQGKTKSLARDYLVILPALRKARSGIAAGRLYLYSM